MVVNATVQNTHSQPVTLRARVSPLLEVIGDDVIIDVGATVEIEASSYYLLRDEILLHEKLGFLKLLTEPVMDDVQVDLQSLRPVLRLQEQSSDTPTTLL